MKKFLSVILCVMLLSSCAYGAFTPGTYEGEGKGYSEGSPVKVKVTVDADKITAVEIDAPEEVPFGVQNFENYAGQLIGKNEAKIDAVSNATMTRDGIVEAVNKALKAGAVPIEEQMKMNASSDPKIITGDLYSSIHTHGVKQKRGGSGKQITIGVKHSEKGAFYANPLEWGHGGPAPAPPHPFVRPAFDVRYPDACEEMKRVLRDALKP